MQKNLYICGVELPGSAYISAKVFSCPLWKMWKFSKTQDYGFQYARAMIMQQAPILGAGLHIRPSVELSVVYRVAAVPQPSTE